MKLGSRVSSAMACLGVICLLQVCLQSNSAIAKEERNEALKKLGTSFRECPPFQANVTRVAFQQGRLVITRGRLLFRDATHWRQDEFITVGAMGGELTVVADGQTVWTYDQLIGLVTKERLSVHTAFPYHWLKTIDVANDSAFKVLGVTALDTKTGKVRALEIEKAWPHASTGETDSDQPVRTKLWIGADDGLPYKVTNYNAKGEEIAIELYDSHVSKPALDDGLFSFTAPKNVKIVDTTAEETDQKSTIIKIPVHLQGKRPSDE